jgi:hypothetical protein
MGFLSLMPPVIGLALVSFVLSLTLWGGFIYVTMAAGALFVIGALVETWMLVTGRLSGFGR